jgi:hypothetical protein
MQNAELSPSLQGYLDRNRFSLLERLAIRAVRDAASAAESSYRMDGAGCSALWAQIGLVVIEAIKLCEAIGLAAEADLER